MEPGSSSGMVPASGSPSGRQATPARLRALQGVARCQSGSPAGRQEARKGATGGVLASPPKPRPSCCLDGGAGHPAGPLCMFTASLVLRKLCPPAGKLSKCTSCGTACSRQLRTSCWLAAGCPSEPCAAKATFMAGTPPPSPGPPPLVLGLLAAALLLAPHPGGCAGSEPRSRYSRLCRRDVVQGRATCAQAWERVVTAWHPCLQSSHCPACTPGCPSAARAKC